MCPNNFRTAGSCWHAVGPLHASPPSGPQMCHGAQAHEVMMLNLGQPTSFTQLCKDECGGGEQSSTENEIPAEYLRGRSGQLASLCAAPNAQPRAGLVACISTSRDATSHCPQWPRCLTSPLKSTCENSQPKTLKHKHYTNYELYFCGCQCSSILIGTAIAFA